MDLSPPLEVNLHPDSADFHAVGTGVDALLGSSRTASRAGRRDGRTPSEMRPLSLSHGTLVAADGSARIRLGLTDVVVAVYGPMPCPVPRQNADDVHVHVTFRRRDGAAGAANDGVNAGKEAIAARDLTNVVTETVLASLHPRKAVVVAVQVLADNGGMVAAAVNATVMALIDAGVPMQTVPTASSVAVHNGTIVVDPLLVEEAEADALLTFTFDTLVAHQNGFMSVYTEGDCAGASLFAAALKTSRDLATKTTAFLKLSLQQKAAQHLIWNASTT